MAQCMRCRKTLSHNEIGAHKRLINRGAEEFLCRECLAEKFRVSPELIGAIAIDFTASNILPVLRDGTPLSSLDRFKHNPHAYCKMWKHHGASEEAAILTEAAKEVCPELLEPYGGLISSEWCFSKIYETSISVNFLV